jgi:hypothetical protein
MTLALVRAAPTQYAHRPFASPAHLACSPRLLTSPAHLACSPRLLTSPAHLACTSRRISSCGARSSFFRRTNREKSSRCCVSSRAAALFASSCGIHALTASASAAFSRLLLIRRLLLLQHLYELPEGRWFAAKGQHLCPLLLRHRPDGGIVRRGSSRLLLLSFVSRELFRAHLEGSDFRTFSEHVRTSHNTIPPLPALDPPLLIIFFFYADRDSEAGPDLYAGLLKLACVGLFRLRWCLEKEKHRPSHDMMIHHDDTPGCPAETVCGGGALPVPVPVPSPLHRRASPWRPSNSDGSCATRWRATSMRF